MINAKALLSSMEIFINISLFGGLLIGAYYIYKGATGWVNNVIDSLTNDTLKDLVIGRYGQTETRSTTRFSESEEIMK